MPGSAGAWALIAEVDIEEPRVGLGSLAVTAGGSEDRNAWDLSISTKIWRDPSRKWAMPSPLPMTSNWVSTTTGDYARLAKTDYTLTTSSAWVENHRDVSGNIYLEGNGTNERVTSATTYSANQPWFISIYVPGLTGLHDQTILEFGMGTYGGSDTISLRVRANGVIVVYKGSTQIAYDDLDFNAAKQSAGKSVAAQTVNMTIIPVRWYKRDGVTLSSRGELLITTDAGTSLAVQFDDLGSGDNITPSGVIWWQVPQGRPCVQVAKCNFESSGIALYGPAQTLRYAPDSPRTFSFTNWVGKVGTSSATATASLVTATGLTAYSPDGTTTAVRVKVTAAGAIALAAVDAYMEPTQESTYDDPKDITSAIESLSLSVDDWRSGGRTRLTLSARYSALDDAGMLGLSSVPEWPFRLAIKDMEATTPTEIDIFRGIIELDRYEQAPGLANGASDLLTFTGEDRMRELDYGMVIDPLARDGQTVPAAILAILTDRGFDSSFVSASSSSYTIPIDDPVRGKWTECPARGDSHGEFLQGIRERHAADWWLGWAPLSGGYLFRITSPSDLSSSVVATIYPSRPIAASVGSLSADNKHFRVYSSLSFHPVAPEANQVIVIGQRRIGDRRLILAQSNNSAAQDPTTAPASRPNDWTGRTKAVLEVNPGVTNQTQANDLLAALEDRVGVKRYICEFTVPAILIRNDFSRPVWTGDVVRIYTPSGTTYDDVRILAIPQVRSIKEPSATDIDAGARPIREATYRAEVIASGP